MVKIFPVDLPVIGTSCQRALASGGVCKCGFLREFMLKSFMVSFLL